MKIILYFKLKIIKQEIEFKQQFIHLVAHYHP